MGLMKTNGGVHTGSDTVAIATTQCEHCIKAHSHSDENGIFLSRSSCRHEWVQYPFMTETAMAKMGIMVTNWSVHIMMAMA